MNRLREYIDKIKPHFDDGGKYSKLKSTFEAFESFLFVPKKVTTCGTHIKDAIDLKRTMTVVLIALMPALIFGIWNVGYQHYIAIGNYGAGIVDIFVYGAIKVIPIIVVSYVSGLSIEFAFAQYRGHEVNEGFLVSGMLIPLIVPVEIPLWMVSLSTIFAVVIGKEVFGGTGMNVFNPALLSRVFLFFAYPQSMSGDKIWIAEKPDTFSGATPLANMAAGNMDAIPSFYDMFFGFIPGSIGETSKFAILIGAVILIITGVGSFRIMISTVLGGMLMGWLFNLWGVNAYMTIPAYQHLLMGGFLFGAVFMATDPVTAAQTNYGKYIYGILIGILAVLIRVLNPAYPEGMMLAILFMNMFAPLIDHYVLEANIRKRLNRVKLIK